MCLIHLQGCVIGCPALICSDDLDSHDYYYCIRLLSKAVTQDEHTPMSFYFVSIVWSKLKPPSESLPSERVNSSPQDKYRINYMRYINASKVPFLRPRFNPIAQGKALIMLTKYKESVPSMKDTPSLNPTSNAKDSSKNPTTLTSWTNH